jgi:hypothetical protein
MPKVLVMGAGSSRVPFIFNMSDIQEEPEHPQVTNN